MPSPNTILVTMTGAVIANAEMKFDLEQRFEVNFDDPKVKKAKLLVESRVIGLLRGEPRGSPSTVTPAPHHGRRDRHPRRLRSSPPGLRKVREPLGQRSRWTRGIPIVSGRYTLNQTFRIAAQSDSVLCKRPSAEFAPDPALDPLWINYFDPFHGVKKDTFGFQVIVKAVPDLDPPASGEKKTAAAR